jgi:hypothetical protein
MRMDDCYQVVIGGDIVIDVPADLWWDTEGLSALPAGVHLDAEREPLGMLPGQQLVEKSEGSVVEEQKTDGMRMYTGSHPVQLFEQGPGFPVEIELLAGK